MKRLVCVLMLMAMVFSAGAVMALNLNDHVTMAPNGKGDLLLFPLYVAAEGWETKINVINTSLTYPVVAKVVVRSMIYSRELLDFFIYLSPTDVWTGTLENGPNGPRMVSTDDSVLISTSKWASQEEPMERDLIEPCDDLNAIGYVEIFEAWSTLDGPDTDDGVPPIPKDDVKAAFDAATSFSEVVNVLAANYEIRYLTGAVSGTEQATILKDYNVTTGLTLSVETKIGQNANNNMCEVEAALSKNNLAMYYYNTEDEATLHFVTFPTKLSNYDCTECTGVLSEFFSENYSSSDCWSAYYGLRYWDLSENTPGAPDPIFSPVPEEEQFKFPWEVNWVTSFDFIYDEGWTLYKFIKTSSPSEDPVSTTCEPLVDDGDTIIFTGAPAIPTTLFFGANGLSIMGAAYDYGTVTYNDNPVTHYQLKEGGDPVEAVPY